MVNFIIWARWLILLLLSPINIAKLGLGVLVVVGDVVDWRERSLLFLLNVQTLLGASPRRRNRARVRTLVFFHPVTQFLEPRIDKVLLRSFSRKVAVTQAPCTFGSSVGTTLDLEGVSVDRRWT